MRFPSGDPERTERLELILTDDAPVISALTGRKIGPDDTPGEEVPDWLRPVALRVFALRAERIALGGTIKARTSAAGSTRLRSFTAGPYSESYFGPGEAAEWRVLDPDPATHELLWTLATEAMRRHWLRLWGTLEEEPAAAVQAFDWSGQLAGTYRGRRGRRSGW